MWIKILFVVVSIAGVVVIFLVSWFWSMFLIPIVLLLLYDVGSSFWKEFKKKKG
jgi:hypothetical protein